MTVSSKKPTRRPKQPLSPLSSRQLLAAAEPEAAFQEKIGHLFRLNGWHYYHTWNSIHSPEGFPDIVALRTRVLVADDGSAWERRMVVSELKAENGKLTPAQRRWLTQFWLSGKAEVYIWKPSTPLDQIVAILR